MEQTLNLVAQTLYDRKGFNILALDVRGVCNITDYFIIAEGSVPRHVKALADAVSKSLMEDGITPISQEGLQNGDWIVLDFGDMMIHLFLHDLREKYALEQVWHLGKVVDLKIVLDNVGGS